MNTPNRPQTRHRSPSWPSVIVCGLAGGAVNWLTNSQLLAFSVFIGLMVIWALLLPRR